MGGGEGSSGGVGIPIGPIIQLFTGGAKRKSDAEKAITQFRKQVRRRPDLTRQQAIQAGSEKLRRQLFNFAGPVSREAGVSLDQFLLGFLPAITFANTVFGSREARTQAGRQALTVPNIHRLAGIQLGITGFEPILPRRTESPGRPIVGPPDLSRILAVILQSVLDRFAGGSFGRAFPGRIEGGGRLDPRNFPAGSVQPGVPRRQPTPGFPRPRQTIPPNRPQRPPWWPAVWRWPWDVFFPQTGGRQVPLLDAFGSFLGQVTQAAGAIAPVLQQFGVGQQQQVFGMPGSGFPVQQAGVGGALLRQLPGLIGGFAAGEAFEAIQGGGQAAAGCVVPRLTQSMRLPRTHDVPVSDSVGNVHQRTYVLAPRVSYKVTVRPRRRHHHHRGR